MSTEKITMKQALEYEVGSSWWARDAYGEFIRTIAAYYFAWLVARKYRRYETFREYKRFKMNN